MPAPTPYRFAREYTRVVMLLRREYRRLLREYVPPDAETQNTLVEIRVVLVCLVGIETLQDLPELPPRHKLELEGEIGHERQGRHDATKW